ncbi:hypothetical protein L6452_22741 [Arctium lappa]|uniref:Uncharacterized protein n=1 Tax=Arctium lappa TaxID=4217 RepID=A0ACB9AZS4_ARCLA|nr:hypothetical protein L6452_22741 [Arctium lappa]
MPPSPRPRSFFSAILGYNITSEFTFCLVSNFEQKDVEKAVELGEQKSRLRSGLAGSIHDHHSSIKHSEELHNCMSCPEVFDLCCGWSLYQMDQRPRLPSELRVTV